MRVPTSRAALARAVLLAGLLAGQLAGLLASGYAGAETLLVVRKSGDAVDFVDPGSGLRLATVPTGSGPHEISVSPDGRRAVVSNYGTREHPGSTLSVIALEQPRELRRIELAPGARPHGVAWYAPDRIAVTTEGAQQLLLVDPDAGTIVHAIDTAQDTSHMVVVNRAATRAYVTNIGSGTTTAIDLAAGRKLADWTTGAGSEALALSPDGRELWVAARTAGEIAVIDTVAGRIVARLPVPGMPIRLAMAPDGRSVLVSCAQSGELVAFATQDRSQLARRRLDVAVASTAQQRAGAQLAPGSVIPVGLLWSRDGRSAYVAATMGDRVVQFDAATLATLRSIPVDGEPDGLARTDVQPQAVCHGCMPLPGEIPDAP